VVGIDGVLEVLGTQFGSQETTRFRGGRFDQLWMQTVHFCHSRGCDGRFALNAVRRIQDRFNARI
jgi:hypothetical protein